VDIFYSPISTFRLYCQYEPPSPSPHKIHFLRRLRAGPKPVRQQANFIKAIVGMAQRFCAIAAP